MDVWVDGIKAVLRIVFGNQKFKFSFIFENWIETTLKADLYKNNLNWLNNYNFEVSCIKQTNKRDYSDFLLSRSKVH